MQFVQDIEYPKEFPALLMDLSREVLREQPENIYEFALKYFQQLKQASDKVVNEPMQNE
ncbi:Regulatory_subunit of type II PKA R-subunit [Hexamita inflata]|uniref:Regulatory subunit of type II PKA R-subunit n=1 Tax=Hexamita inflata TaxID=28002 RepID=A0AA86R164_9EUKA|nr:Regulatory subunit of type II PKA R-subunit [Hexamita inflata]CAI9939906.1 Regulatory subunit of type II PKA R-subunit [Hexamita inflata]CAI9961239.1 Regulatory subunit of type II PKA R-subunit [Hexamita inflata]CAI9963903.1 Regulatory subunit of type II PKA R-subunit [Hexamita inflata]